MCSKHYLLSFFCESNLQPVPDCERHYHAGYGSIQFSHNQAEVDLGTMPLYSQIPRNTASLLRAMKNRSYWKIPELLSIKLSLSRSVGTEKTRHLETLRLSISSSFKMIASGTILTKGFLILLFSQLIFTTAGNYSMFNVIFFFGRLKLISRFGCQLWFVNMKIKNPWNGKYLIEKAVKPTLQGC